MAEPPTSPPDGSLSRAPTSTPGHAHCGPDSTDDTTIEHPVAVARLLDEAGFGDEVVATAATRDVVEGSTQGIDRIRDGFGDEVVNVEALTEDDTIVDYTARKAEHRKRVLEAGAVPASIYAAGRRSPVYARTRRAGEDPGEERLDHYWDTLRLFTARRPELPFLSEIAVELPALERALDEAAEV